MPIPLSEILAYCNLFYIAELNEREQLFRYVSAMDNAYIDYHAEKQKSKSTK